MPKFGIIITINLQWNAQIWHCHPRKWWILIVGSDKKAIEEYQFLKVAHFHVIWLQNYLKTRSTGIMLITTTSLFHFEQGWREIIITFDYQNNHLGHNKTHDLYISLRKYFKKKNIYLFFIYYNINSELKICFRDRVHFCSIIENVNWTGGSMYLAMYIPIGMKSLNYVLCFKENVVDV